MNQYKCLFCGKWFERTPENFPTGRKSPDGMANRCRACWKIYQDAYYQRNKEKMKKQIKEARLKRKDYKTMAKRCLELIKKEMGICGK